MSTTSREPPLVAGSELTERTCSAAALLQGGDQVVDGGDRVVELGGGVADAADDVRVAPTEAAVAVAGGLLLGPLVLAGPAAAVVDLHDLHAVHGSLALVVGEQPDVGPPRMAGGGHRPAPPGRVQ